MRFFAVALFFCGATASYAQAPPTVPQTMGFAGMTLTLNEGARQEIQKDVDLLTRYTRYFNMKVERARTYFPIIEKVFEEEGVPDDFKYLVLQESALVADAVSVSNAVGFWQFKDFTAMEMGMRVDKEIDERMNLVSSTRGAAKYLKQNNYFFNNWLLALQAYQMGAGGVRRVVGDSLNGSKSMDVTPETYWYVKKFLAHKAAFENALAGEAQMKVMPYQGSPKKTLKEIADEVSVEESVLKEYNKWLKSPAIPDDKVYVVLVPTGNATQDFNQLVLGPAKPGVVASASKEKTDAEGRLVINSIPVVVAKSGESAARVAQRGGISLSAFLKNNDLPEPSTLRTGESYFLSRKKTTAEQETYTVKAGDNIWSISQQFGVRIKNIKKYNGLHDDAALVPGTLVWLKGNKPSGETAAASAHEAAGLEEDSFDWYIKSPKEAETASEPVQLIREPALSSTAAFTPVETSTTVINTVPAETREEIKAEQPRPTEHSVLAGETLYSISKQYSLEVTDLLTWNNLNVQDGLKPGQILKIVENRPRETEPPAVKSPEPLSITHEVKSSDTLYSVARQYGVTIKDIMDWNHKKDFSLSRGEKLEIRQTNR